MKLQAWEVDDIRLEITRGSPNDKNPLGVAYLVVRMGDKSKWLGFDEVAELAHDFDVALASWPQDTEAKARA